MKEEINRICTQLNDGQICVAEATEQLLLLLSVKEVTKQLPEDWKVECKKCGAYNCKNNDICIVCNCRL